MPVRLTDCWVPTTLLLLSVTINDAARVEAPVGAKVTLMVQLPLPASELPQLFVSAKSPGLVPAKVILLMVSAAFPVLFSVTAWATLVVPTFWLLKLKLVVVMAAKGPVPVPVTFTVCGLPKALSVSVKVAVRVPEPVGAKVTLIVQLPFAATELPHVLVAAKSPGLAPEKAMPLIESAVFPVLLRVTVWAALVEPTDVPLLGGLGLKGMELTTGPHCPHAGESHRLRTAWGVVGDGHKGRTCAGDGGRESHTDIAIASGRQRTTTGVGLGKVSRVRTRHCKTADSEGCGPCVAECDGLWPTRRPQGLTIKSQVGSRKADRGTATRARQAYGLRTARRGVGNGHTGRPSAREGGRKSHINRSNCPPPPPSCRNCCFDQNRPNSFLLKPRWKR